MKFLATLTTFLLASQSYAEAPCDIKIREGKITAVDCPASVQAFARKSLVGATSTTYSDDTNPSELRPADGKSFVVLSVSLAAARSISYLDYQLQAEGQSEGFRAIAISHSDKAFSKTRWEVKAEGEAKVAWSNAAENKAADTIPAGVVKLLFEVPAGQTRFTLFNRHGALQKRYEVKTVIDSVNGSKDPVVATPAPDASATSPVPAPAPAPAPAAP